MHILARLIVAGAICFGAINVHSEEPSVILSTSGQPDMALFEKPERQAFAFGCLGLRSFWSGVPVRAVSSAMYYKQLDGFTIVDLHCDQRVKKYQSTGEPNSIVVIPRGGVPQRHYVDGEAWHRSISGPVIQASKEELEKLAPKRGVDFTSTKQAPGPGPTKPPKNCKFVCENHPDGMRCYSQGRDC